MRAALLCTLAACAARAASADALGEPMFFLHEDTYQLTPRRLSQWEAGQFAQQGGAWVDLGSVEGGGYEAFERGVVNLELASRLLLHGDVRNDLDAGGRVTRPVVDLLVNVAPGLWLGASGVPATRKQDYGIGGSVLFASPSRRRYLFARLVADQFLYNRTNVDGGTRASPVLHGQVEGRWEEGRWSLAGWLDAATDSETSFPGAPLVTFEAAARRELLLHARYAGPAVELDARLDLLHTRTARTELGASSGLRETVATLRLDALLAPIAATRWRPRLGLRGLTGEEVRDAGGVPFRLTRREPAARIAAQREDGIALWELGYAFAVPVLRQTGGGSDRDAAPYQDVLYGSSDLSLGPVSLRALVSWEVRNARFGGANANVLMWF